MSYLHRLKLERVSYKAVLIINVSLLERSTDFLLRLAPAFAPGRETLRLWMIGAWIWADRKRCAYTVPFRKPYWENPLLIR